MPAPILAAQPVSVLLPGDLRTRARAYREAQGVPLSEALRRGLDEFLAKRGFPAAPSSESPAALASTR